MYGTLHVTLLHVCMYVHTCTCTAICMYVDLHVSKFSTKLHIWHVCDVPVHTCSRLQCVLYYMYVHVPTYINVSYTTYVPRPPPPPPPTPTPTPRAAPPPPLAHVRAAVGSRHSSPSSPPWTSTFRRRSRWWRLRARYWGRSRSSSSTTNRATSAAGVYTTCCM